MVLTNGDYYFYFIILIFIFIMIIYYLIYEKNKICLPNEVYRSPDGIKIYEARFGPDYKYYVPDEILNDPTIQIVYLE